MKIDISDAIENEGEAKKTVYDGSLPGLDFMGEHFFFDKVRVDAEYLFDGEGIAITGKISAQIEVNCSRCLRTFIYPEGLEFSEYYEKQPREEDGAYAYTSEIIDLDKMLQDNIVLSLPMKFLCREDCKGICTVCGADLNEGDCGCVCAEKEGPMSRLSELNDDKEV